MKSSVTIAWTLAGLLSLPLFAQAATDKAISKLLARVSEANDPMPADGAFKDQKVENIKSRTLKLLTPAEKSLFGIPAQDLAFANYRDHLHFYIATISGLQVDSQNKPTASKSIVSEVRVRSEHWEAKTNPALAGVESHSYLQFNFVAGEGVRLLYDQTTMTPVDPSASLISSAVLSIEAIRPQSQPNADFMPHSLVFDFAIGHLFYSAYDRLLYEMEDPGRVVEDSALNLAGSQSRVAAIARPEEAILYRAIFTSDQLGRSQVYNVIENNCTNRALDLLDNSLAYPAPFSRPIFKSGIQTAVNSNANVEIGALKALIQTNAPNLSPSVLQEFDNVTPDKIAGLLLGGVDTSTDINHYYSWLPPLLNAHLAARGLLSVTNQ